MTEQIKNKIDSYIQTILDKEEITSSEFAILVQEYQRRAYEEKQKDKMKTIMETLTT